MVKKSEILHEGYGYFTISRRVFKDGTALFLEARLTDGPKELNLTAKKKAAKKKVRG